MTVKVNIDCSEFNVELEKYLDENARDICIQIRKDAKAGTYSSSHGKFKDISGRLRKSIKIKKSKFEGGGYLTKAGGKGAMQSWLVEHGHGGPRPAPAHPYLRPALARNIEYAKKKFGVK